MLGFLGQRIKRNRKNGLGEARTRGAAVRRRQQSAHQGRGTEPLAGRGRGLHCHALGRCALLALPQLEAVLAPRTAGARLVADRAVGDGARLALARLAVKEEAVLANKGGGGSWCVAFRGTFRGRGCRRQLMHEHAHTESQ